MKNRVKGKDGKYTIKTKKYDILYGSRASVMHGNAYQTKGGLKKDNLKYNKQGRIVSKLASKKAAKNQTLKKKGYVTKKGVFGAYKNGKAVIKTKKTKRNKTRRKRR